MRERERERERDRERERERDEKAFLHDINTIIKLRLMFHLNTSLSHQHDTHTHAHTHTRTYTRTQETHFVEGVVAAAAEVVPALGAGEVHAAPFAEGILELTIWTGWGGGEHNYCIFIHTIHTVPPISSLSLMLIVNALACMTNHHPSMLF